MDTSRQRIINIKEDKKIYFCSDQHFGAPDEKNSKVREAKFICFLDEIKKDAQILFLLGDLFDFWHEYQTVVPKGYVRVLGKLAELSDFGITMYFFTGNHDLWMKDYLKTELNITIFNEPQEFLINNKQFLIAHGDGLGPGDFGYKRMKKIFTNPICQFLFRWLHPDIGMKLGTHLSRKNKMISGDDDVHFLGEDKEWLILYSKDKLKEKKYDFFVFGHRHLPMIHQIEQAKYINLGDWISYFTYGEFSNQEFKLLTFE